jgi:hypothetical protein
LKLTDWCQKRLVPKILLATQGKVLEAVVDDAGEWLPSVPVITVTPRSEEIWKIAAVLLSPPICAYVSARFAGAGLTMTSIKLSAKQVRQLPLPVDQEEWAAAAAVLERANNSDRGKVPALVEMGRMMCDAYHQAPDDLLPWWQGRAGIQTSL